MNVKELLSEFNRKRFIWSSFERSHRAEITITSNARYSYMLRRGMEKLESKLRKSDNCKNYDEMMEMDDYHFMQEYINAQLLYVMTNIEKQLEIEFEYTMIETVPIRNRFTYLIVIRVAQNAIAPLNTWEFKQLADIILYHITDNLYDKYDSARISIVKERSSAIY